MSGVVSLRAELLDREIFATVIEAKVLIERRRRDYKTRGPHSALRYRPPAPEAIMTVALGLGVPPLHLVAPLPGPVNGQGLTQKVDPSLGACHEDVKPLDDAPKIYHITHVMNLAQIIKDSVVWSDAQRIERELDCQIVGMSSIKERRLHHLRVRCHPSTFVGEYVPFYFCPRSIMLYILHKGNHPELTYRGGQRPMVHLQADMDSTISWADEQGIPWAFSDTNAGAYLARFFKRREDLDKVSWEAVQSEDFREMQVKEGKQAEFLVHNSFPWQLVERIGVCCQETLLQVHECLTKGAHKPLASVERAWYFPWQTEGIDD
jgi:hypothetical protein